jgi:two-component system sensor kinase FixL
MHRLRLPFEVRGQVVKLGYGATLWISGAMLALLVLLEWYSHLGVSLGLLYVLPVVLAATVMSRAQIVMAAIACAALRGLFVMNEGHIEQLLRFSMATMAYSGCGLLMSEISRTRRVVFGHYARLRAEQQLRRRAERQLRLLAESSPAAILTVARDGRIVAANRAAEDMLVPEPGGALLGQPVRDYLPVLHDALSVSASIGGMRTSTSTWGRRADGSAFPATIWFSVYGSHDSRHLAAIVVDVSDEVREREYARFEDLHKYNRLLAGAVSHEIRNLCSAAGVVCSNLSRHPALQDDPDFAALRSLVQALLELASFDLRRKASATISAIRLQALATELQVIIAPDWADIDGEVRIDIAADFPPVRGDRHALLQVLLNLSQNALRAVDARPERRLTLSARVADGQAVLQVRDSGPGIAQPELLFQPFRPGADGTGLGLYISRALMSHQDGQLRHLPGTDGCCFELLLPLAQPDESVHD